MSAYPHESHQRQEPGSHSTATSRRGSRSSPRSPACLWISTGEASAHLGISRKTLFRLKKAGILKQQRHWARKNPASPCSDLLWHVQRCEMALGRI
jgi:hypothetical protein